MSRRHSLKKKNARLPDWASEFDCGTWADFLLKFIVSHPALTCAIPATTWATLDSFGAPFAPTLPILAAMAVAAGIWKAVSPGRPDHSTRRIPNR